MGGSTTKSASSQFSVIAPSNIVTGETRWSLLFWILFLADVYDHIKLRVFISRTTVIALQLTLCGTGVKFMYECVMGLRKHEGQGCILADEMYVVFSNFAGLS